MLEEWYLELGESPVDIPEEKIREIGEEIFQKLIGNGGRKFQMGMLLAAAAIAVIIASAILEVVFYKRDLVVNNATQDIPPGGNRASLTLANGQVVDLTHVANGGVAVQQGTRVMKNRAGQLVYEDSGQPEVNGQIGENSIRPRRVEYGNSRCRTARKSG